VEANYRASDTARWTAAARAKETAREDRLFDDPYADALAGDLGRRALEASERASGGDNPYLPVRTRWFDDLVGAQADRVGQVVMLGAGFDTRAMRLALPEALHWFELDAAEVFATKEPILADIGANPSCLRFVVAADLRTDWSERLGAAGFERGRATLWVAEGLFFYLDAVAVAGLLRRANELSGEGSMFAADLFGTGLLRRRDWGAEPPFCSDEPAALFSRAGWSKVQIAEPWQDPTVLHRLPSRETATGSALDSSDRSWFVLAHCLAASGTRRP